MEIFCKKLGVACSALKEWEGQGGAGRGEEVLREREGVGECRRKEGGDGERV